jgi:hypothetical protein
MLPSVGVVKCICVGKFRKKCMDPFGCDAAAACEIVPMLVSKGMNKAAETGWLGFSSRVRV